jgi:hypothetical protein
LSFVGDLAPTVGDVGTTLAGPTAWKSHSSDTKRRGLTLSFLYLELEKERVGDVPKFVYGRPRDARITIWIRARSFTLLGCGAVYSEHTTNLRKPGQCARSGAFVAEHAQLRGAKP